VSTVLQVENNKVVSLGGITRKNKDKTVKRFPILGYVLPFLFSQTIEVETESELGIYIIPKIITSIDEITVDPEKMK
jgi:type II secretory pathway component GspD/PulD (secretin)